MLFRSFKVKKGIRRTDAEVLSAESALAETRRKESEARNKVNEAQIVREGEEKKIIEGKEKLNRAQYNLQYAVDQKVKKISALGAQPDVEENTTYITETHYEYRYRGGLGFLDYVFGPKEVAVERKVPRTTIDDSKRREWVRERDRILASCNSEIEQLQSILDTDKNRISGAEKMLKKARLDEQQAKEDLEFYKQKYDSDKSTLENLKRKANQELLNSLRNSLITQLEKYCDYENGDMAKIVREYVNETIEKNSKIIRDKTAQFYEVRLEALVDTYKNEINGKAQAKIGRASCRERV